VFSIPKNLKINESENLKINFLEGKKTNGQLNSGFLFFCLQKKIKNGRNIEF
jgi:hypothetical protein